MKKWITGIAVFAGFLLCILLPSVQAVAKDEDNALSQTPCGTRSREANRYCVPKNCLICSIRAVDSNIVARAPHHSTRHGAP